MRALPLEAVPQRARALTVQDVHETHGDFVWASLQRLGARQPYLEDLFQEVFVVVHRRLDSFEERSRLTTWLFGICVRVVAAYRRRAYVRFERPTEESHGGEPSTACTPDTDLARKQALARLDEVLNAMDLQKRAILLMAVVEEMPSEEIATILGIPVGTVYSRVHHARKEFQRILTTLNERDRRKEGR